MDKIRQLKNEATLFLLAYELADGKDLQLLRHSIDSLNKATILEKEENRERDN